MKVEAKTVKQLLQQVNHGYAIEMRLHKLKGKATEPLYFSGTTRNDAIMTTIEWLQRGLQSDSIVRAE
jgi:hypothetical protein